MIFWSGYSRTVRDGEDWLIWVRRSRCVACPVSHCLLPAFCLFRRLYGAEAIGPALKAIIDGALAGEVVEDTREQEATNIERINERVMKASLRWPALVTCQQPETVTATSGPGVTGYRRRAYPGYGHDTPETRSRPLPDRRSGRRCVAPPGPVREGLSVP